MKKNVLYSLFILFFIGVNFFQSLQLKYSDFSLQKVMNTAFASSEEDEKYYVDNIVENGLCYECILNVVSTCECKRYSTYCPSGGSSWCEYSFDIEILPGTCNPEGGSC